MPSEKTLRPLFLAAAAFALYMALIPKPPALPIDRFGDKFEHMLAFAVLTMLARLAWQRASPWRILERLSFFGALIEVFQSIPSLHRDCDPKDWVADTLSVAVVLLLTSRMPLSKRGKPEHESG